MDKKYDALRRTLQEFGSVAVAFSGGVDSALLVKAAHDVLGKNVLAVTVRSCLCPPHEQEEAAAFCAKEEIRHVLLDFDALSVDGIVHNRSDRCYVCKREILTLIMKTAREHGIAYVAEGSNADDDNESRPGTRAIRELGVKSPLREAGLTKRDIRTLSHDLELPTWDKPALACLATRFPYGETITTEKLDMVDRAEQVLRALGCTQVRVRCHGDLARIETDESGFPLLCQEKTREEILIALKGLGFTYVSLDLKGYQTGSMNLPLQTQRL